MDCNKLCQNIQKIMERYNREVEQTVVGKHAVSINIVEIVDADDQHLPKLENKE
jgi:hypothetical protein